MITAMIYNGIERKDEIKKIIEAVNPDIIVFCVDFDGTLVKICKSPYDVVVRDELRDFLTDMNNTDGVYLCIVTGRELSDIENRIGIKNNIIYSGNHGFEIKSYYKHFKLDFLTENADKYIPLLADVLDKVKNIRLDNFILENKKFSISVHYRLLDNDSAKYLKKNVKDILNGNPEFKKYLHIARGKKIIEIRPKIDWNKGSACKYITKELLKTDALISHRVSNHDTAVDSSKVNVLKISLGDDVTDETMFYDDYSFTEGNIAADVYTINCVIGKKKSAANFYIENYNYTPIFIKEILAILNERHSTKI